ncbi:MAG: carboxypeptidase regulatory-like domain-containing protein [Candidatus Sulfotelmatobacter sp.]
MPNLRRAPVNARSLFLFLLLIPILVPSVLAQLYAGSVRGVVKDASGAVIAGAQVKVVDQDKGFSFSATSDSAGRYLVPQLAPDRYSVQVDAAGFQSERKDGFVIAVDQNISVDFMLKVGSQAEVVDVHGTGVELQTEDATTGQVVDRKFINDLPLINRNFANLAFLAPGITEVDSQADPRDNNGPSNNFNANGGRNATSDFLLDGVTISNYEQNSGIIIPSYTPSVDAVEEFNVETGSFNAEYGFSGATIVNIVTRSGTNKFHGSIYDYLRNQLFDANSWFNDFVGASKPELQRNNFGGTFGGAIKKDKIFFFFDFDGSRANDGAFFTGSVPTQNERNGDFGEVCTLNGGSFNAQGQCTGTTSGGNSGQLFDPYSANSNLSIPVRSTFIPFNNLATYTSPGSPALAGTPFQPKATGPGNLINPVSNKFLQFFPLPNLPTTGVGTPNWFASGATPSSNNQFDLKIDYRINQANLLSGKYSQQWGNSQSFNCFKNEADPCNGGPVTGTNHIFALNDTHTFGPNKVLTLAYGLNRFFSFEKGLPGYYPNADPVTDLGLPSYFDLAASQVTNINIRQLPTIGISGYAPAGTGNIGTQFFSILHEGSDTHQALASFGWVRGAHELKFGGEVRVHQINYTQPGWPAGQGNFDFTGTSADNGTLPGSLSDNNPGGDGLASFLIGVGSLAGPGGTGGIYEVPNVVSTQNVEFGGFVQDNYRVTPKLTLNLGMRYELVLPRTERYNRMNSLDPNLVNPLNGGTISYTDPLTNQAVTRTLFGGEVFASPSNRHNYIADHKDWQPRFGFAYQLPHTLVVRGGYGIYFSTPRYGASGTGPYGFEGYDVQTQWIPSFNGAGVLPGALFSDPYRSYGTGYPDSGPRNIVGNSLGALNDVGFAGVGPIEHESRNRPYEQSWSFGVQKALPWKIIAEANYVGKKGTHLYFGGYRERDFLGQSFEKQRLSGQITTAQIQNLATQQVANPFYGIITDPNSNLSAQTIPAYQLELPYPEFTNFDGDSPPIATSIYHSAQFRVEKQFSNGLQLLATYVVSKSIDDSSETDDSEAFLGGGLQGGNVVPVPDPNNLKPERSESVFDIPQVFQFTYTYALPFGRGKQFGGGISPVVNAFLGGWQTNGIWRFADGRPILPFIGIPIGTEAIPTYSQRPDLVAPLHRSSGRPEADVNLLANPGSYFTNNNALAEPAPYTVGTSPRTITTARQPGSWSADLSVFKQFPLHGEGRYFEYRFEAFNALNHPNFNGPDTGVGDPTFGQISSVARPQRLVQMALKLYF